MNREQRARAASSGRAGRRPIGAGAVLVTTLLGSLSVVSCSDGGSGPQVVIVIEPPASAQMLTGDVMALVSTSSGAVGPIEWATSDDRVATVDAAGVVEALRPGDVRITAGAPGAVEGGVELTVSQRPGGYSADEVDYFAEIAFGSEFGASSPFLRRWPADAPPRMSIHGSPSALDLETLDAVRSEIGALTGLVVDVVDASQRVDVHFVPVADFPSILPQAPAGNIGVVWLWWSADQYLYRSVVLVGSDIDPSLRQHIIREEVTQMLGLLQDSFRYPESIFYQSPSSVTEYAPIDRSVIELLYRPELDVGMSVEAATREARRLLRAETLMARGDGAAGEEVASGARSSRPPAALGRSIGETDVPRAAGAGGSTACARPGG